MTRSLSAPRRRLPAVLGLLALCAAMAAGPAAAQMSLREAVGRAVERDPGVTADRQRVAQRSVEIEAARDGYYPSLSLAGDTNTTDVNGPNVTLTLSQILFDWGAIRSRIDAASQERVRAVSDLKMTVEDLTLLVAGFYLDFETAEAKIARTRDYTAFAERIAGHAENRARAGAGDAGEVARARLEIARAGNRLAELEAERRMALAQIDYLAGGAPSSVAPPPALGFAARYGNPAKLASAVKLAPDYIAARAEADGARAGVETARAARLPAIRLQAQGRQDLDGGRSRVAIGLNAGVDLDGGSLAGRRIQAATLELQAAQSGLAAAERDLTNAARNALDRLAVLRGSETSGARQLEQAEQVLETYEQQFVAGQRELIDLLTTGRDLYDTRIELIDTRAESRRTEYEAARDLGVLGTLIVASGQAL
ncbi:TolC family protein [Mangrovicoccus algicola]|uniref:TolC family protein n=1 Tax=Mangrovicoccus algicola TaxID=2771008 RepID=A0A8J6YWX4_9RHOB|nr:TolC family protein [Mangrovicoccus algicola]MBE3637553.1 TolC family protein [Mangrovicoccus algicola]